MVIAVSSDFVLNDLIRNEMCHLERGRDSIGFSIRTWAFDYFSKPGIVSIRVCCLTSIRRGCQSIQIFSVDLIRLYAGNFFI